MDPFAFGSMEQALPIFLALLAGLAVAAVAGLRAFLPLFAIGLAALLGLLEVHTGARWLASDPALVCLGFATVLEIAADKLPVVDHALDVVGTVVRPAAGAFAAYGVLVHWPTPWAQILAVILATGTLAVHSVKTQLRLGSTAATLGHANPLVSVGEDVVSLATLVAALLAPLVGLLLVVIVVGAGIGLARRARAARRA